MPIGTATNIEMQFVDSKDAVINLTGSYNGSGDLTLAAGETKSSATYKVQYYTNDAVNVGTVVTVMQ